MNPELSIGMPVYNGANFIAQALDSILAQDFADFELIICDNASTDATADICHEYADRDARIRYIRNAENIGAAPNFNRCVEFARAPLFKWAAHDDLLAPGYLRRCVEALRAAPDAVLCHSLVSIIDPGGESIGTYDSALTGADSRLPHERFAALTLNRHLCTDMFGVIRTALLRRSRQHGAYYGGDRAMLGELALLGRFLTINEPLFLNREHPDRFVRAVPARQWQSWHAGATPGSMINPTWRLYRDYRDAVDRHVRDVDERRRCHRILRRWWFVDWNLGRLGVDLVGRAFPTFHGIVRRLKLSLYGKLPQVREHRGGHWAAATQAPPERLKVVYIGGWGRSGSSLLANILGSSAAAVSVGELRYLWDRGMVENKRCGCGDVFEACEFWQSVLQAAGIEASPALGQHFSEAIGSKATLDQLLAMLTGRERRYRQKRRDEIHALEKIYTSIAQISGAKVIVDASKTPPYALNLLANENIELYFIHLIRDPRAVAYSWSRKRETKEQDDELLPQYTGLKSGIYWAGFNVLGMLFRWRRAAHYRQVRYEDFCANPRQVAAEIFSHCGITDPQLHWYDDHEVEVAAQHSISGNPSRFNLGRVRVRPDVAWTTSMSAGARRVVTAICASLFPVFGYRIREPREKLPTG